MTKYQFTELDGQTIEARDAAEVVKKMHALAWSQSPSDREFMQSVADRLVMQSSIEVRWDTAEHFVEDLLKHGVLTTDVE